MDALHQGKNALDFALIQHGRQTRRFFWADDIIEPRKINAKNLFVEKQQGRKCLLLRCRGYIALNGQMRKKRRNLPRSHVARMPQTVKAHETAYPVDIRLLRP